MRQLLILAALVGSLVLCSAAEAGGRRFLFPNAAAFRLNSQQRAVAAQQRLQLQQLQGQAILVHPQRVFAQPAPVILHPQPFFAPGFRGQTIIVR